MRGHLLLVLTFGAVAPIATVAEPAATSCAGPSMRATPSAVGPGAVVLVDGLWFGDDCYDTAHRRGPTAGSAIRS